MDIDFPIFDGLPDVSNVEIVGKMTVVCMEPALNFFALLGSEKTGAASQSVLFVTRP